jgi:hypothetical protein
MYRQVNLQSLTFCCTFCQSGIIYRFLNKKNNLLLVCVSCHSVSHVLKQLHFMLLCEVSHCCRTCGTFFQHKHHLYCCFGVQRESASAAYGKMCHLFRDPNKTLTHNVSTTYHFSKLNMVICKPLDCKKVKILLHKHFDFRKNIPVFLANWVGHILCINCLLQVYGRTDKGGG